MVINTDTYNVQCEKVRDFGVLSPKLVVFIKPFPQASGKYAEDRQKDCKSQRWCITPWREHLPDTTGLLHISTHRDVTAHSRTTQVQTRQESQHKDGEPDTKSHP